MFKIFCPLFFLILVSVFAENPSFLITFQNGQKVEAKIMESKISVNDGEKSFFIVPSDIEDIAFDSTLSGTCKNAQGTAFEFQDLFVLQDTLKIKQHAESAEEIAWDTIQSITCIKREEPPEELTFDIVEELAFQEKLFSFDTPECDEIEQEEKIAKKTITHLNPDKVTNDEYARFVQAVGYPPPAHWVGGIYPEELKDVPVVNVSYRDAFLYSVWAGSRLPTEDELQLAYSLGTLNDADDDIFEWTATPTMENKDDAPLEEIASLPILHRIYTKNDRENLSLKNSARQHNLGFRCTKNGSAKLQD